jgi:HEAT repeat protein
VSALETTLREGAPDVRAAAATALGQINERTAISALMTMLNDPNAQVQWSAIRALGEFEADASQVM